MLAPTRKTRVLLNSFWMAITDVSFLHSFQYGCHCSEMCRNRGNIESEPKMPRIQRYSPYTRRMDFTKDGYPLVFQMSQIMATEEVRDNKITRRLKIDHLYRLTSSTCPRNPGISKMINELDGTLAHSQELRSESYEKHFEVYISWSNSNLGQTTVQARETM